MPFVARSAQQFPPDRSLTVRLAWRAAGAKGTKPGSPRSIRKYSYRRHDVRDVAAGRPIRTTAAEEEPGVCGHCRPVTGHRHRGEYDDLLDRQRTARAPPPRPRL